MSDDNSSGDSEKTPYTTEELNDQQLGELSLPDQIRYAIYNGNYRLDEIVDISTFSAGWTTDIIEDMVDEDELIEDSDQFGLFYTMPQTETEQRISDEELDELHEQALQERASTAIIGDEQDVQASVQESTTSTDTDTDSTDDDVSDDMTTPSEPTPDVAHTDAAAQPVDDTVTGPQADPQDVAQSRASNNGTLPVNRNYDWEDHKLDDSRIAEYIEANGEFDDVVRQIEDRRTTQKEPHFRLVGPTGCGKTSFAENIAAGMDAPYFEIQCHEGLRPNNLLGMPTYVGDETWWVDGPLTKALLASRDRPVVVTFDEVNRTTSRTLGVIMSAMDHRATVKLNARGGERIEGDPMNLIVFSTMNTGDGYVTNRIDLAQLRRLGNTKHTDYIGMYDVKKEAKLVNDRTPVSLDVATELVECANSIRRKANERDSSLHIGIPTSVLLDWAKTAWSYRDDDSADGGPLVKAGHESVINLFYKDDENAEDVVTTTIESHLRGMEIDYEQDTPDGEDDPAGEQTIDISDETWLMCDSCGWYAESEDADTEVVTTMQCPQCDNPLTPKEAN